MSKKSWLWPLVAAVAFCDPVFGLTEFVEDWDTTPAVPNDQRGWVFADPLDFVSPTGGNPDAYLRVNGLDTFAPSPSTTPGLQNLYAGDVDYASMQVVSIGVDVIVHSTDFPSGGRPLSLLLINDNGTPANFSDDFAASFVGVTTVPEQGQGWRSFAFDIPSQSLSVPAGWTLLTLGGGTPPFDWQDVITNVDRVEFFYGDPEFVFIFQIWDTGIDNFRFAYEEGGDTAVPAVPQWGIVVMVLAVLGAASVAFRRKAPA